MSDNLKYSKISDLFGNQKPLGIDYSFLEEGTQNLATPNVFSFGIFYPRSGDKYTNIDWYNRYLGGQLRKMAKFFNNTDWDDFCIIHFIHKPILNLRHRTGDEDNEKTGLEIVKRYKSIFPEGKYLPIQYDDPNKKNTVFIGTLVRFTTLIMKNIKTTIFRDAHTTMPNNNSIDYSWYKTWLGTGKMFWSYNMIKYDPEHAKTAALPLAAAWGARNTGINRKTILTTSSFRAHFENNIVNATSGYGIDEHVLLYFVNNKYYFDNAYIVGMTHLFSLFTHKINERQFIVSYSDGKKEYDVEPFFDVATKIKKIPFKNIQINTDLTSNVSETYLQEIGCLVKYLNQTLTTEFGEEPTVTELFDSIKKLQDNESEPLLSKLYRMVPTKWHLFSFLYDADAGDPTAIDGVNFEDITLTEYLDMMEPYFLDPNLNLDNQCDIVGKYFTGGVMNYDKYQYNIKNKKVILPDDISLPYRS